MAPCASGLPVIANWKMLSDIYLCDAKPRPSTTARHGHVAVYEKQVPKADTAVSASHGKVLDAAKPLEDLDVSGPCVSLGRCQLESELSLASCLACLLLAVSHVSWAMSFTGLASSTWDES